MSDEKMSEEFRVFVVENFESIESIELLLLLKNTSDQCLSADELNNILRSNLKSVMDRLGGLEKKGFIKVIPDHSKPTYTYKCEDPDKMHMVDMLSKQYIVRRFSIINMLYGGERYDLHQFSDAFSLRKKKRDGENG